MAKDSSFDIVSQVDMQEVDNAVQQAAKELDAALRPQGHEVARSRSTRQARRSR